MSKRNELNSYIERIRHRLFLAAWVRGSAIFMGSALIVTVALVLLLNQFAFAAGGLTGARLALFIALAASAGFGIAMPLVRLTRARAVHKAEASNPELEHRLTTFYEKEQQGGDPFLELLAADTLTMTQHAEPSSLVEDRRLFALGGAGLGCLTVLVWMILAGPGYLGYGASLLWIGKNAQPFYTITVTPGNTVVRRNSDQLIIAQVTGMQPATAQLFAHYQSASRWEPVAMQGQPNTDGSSKFQFVFAGLPENVEYYVAAGALASPHYTVRVVDLPAVKEIRATYHYPKWTGMKPTAEEHSGDLRAIEGTDAALEIEMDHPLKNGQLTLDDGEAIQLTAGDGNKYHGTVHMEKDGAYHVAAMDKGQPVRLSEDYFIATDKAQPPQISIDRPRGDYRASPIEEVTVGVKAAAEFGLNDVRVHYSVNGGPEREISLLEKSGAKSADGSHTLPLEDFKLVPGDVISVYASARDGHAEARTDMSFIQVEPFEREFSQSQQSGGGGSAGGAGGDNQTEISKREKELISATWKEQNDKSATQKDSVVAGKFLSDAQQKLRDQVMALSARIESRDLSAATEEFTGFDKDMQEAAAAMAPSSDKLKATQWKDALPLEQKALQALLRAEATFRKIEVAFGQSGGGSGNGSAGRDLASLFDLELDTEKNQYETAQSVSPQEQHAKDVEDALAKLDALAKRQEEQANRAPDPQQSFEQRWQQEMLRREAEQLQRQMEQMARNEQQDRQGASSSSSQANSQQRSPAQSSSQNHSDSQGLAGQQSSGEQSSDHADQRVQQALRRLQEAADAMKRSSGPQQNADQARRAAEQLRGAANLLAGTQQQIASGKVDSLAHEAARLKDEERAQSERIDKLVGQQQSINPSDLTSAMARIRERDRIAQERQQLSDDLLKLEKGMRDSAREIAPNQPGVAKQLRDALTEADNSDLDNHTQRTADWLRRGINPNANGTESQIAQGLDKLKQQLQQAQQAMSEQQPGQRHSGREPGQGDQSAALDTIERLRNQIESMTRARGHNSGSDRDQQIAPRGTQQAGDKNGSGAQGSQGRRQARPGQDNQQLGQDADAQSGRPSATRSGNALSRSGDVGGPTDDSRFDGPRTADSTVWGNINTGNNRYGSSARRPQVNDPSTNSADTERTFQQGLRELNQLRQMLKGDPQATKEAEDLARQMQHLDPRRFPGNPAIVEEMHREVLSSIDRLELQLERGATASLASRTGKPQAIPEGYQDSVAEYYRSLSKTP
ncbi:MAG: hypothetical protein WB608_17810 [Terracidiphilus sp.]